MKKILFAICFFIVSDSHAQVHLSGSVYSQNFDALSSGLPVGWGVDTNAKTASPGGSALAGFVAVPGTGTRWGNTSGGFKNVASANGFANFAAGTSALQLAATDRALGVKQTGTFGDAGAAFTFKIDHTFRLSDFELDFKLQSLDSSNGSKVTTWLVQYAVGAIPGSFTTISSGVMTTGGNTFSNTLYNIAFGSAINDKRDIVWIRIVTLSTSIGTGSRATTAIDDVELRWTGVADTGFRPIVQNLFPSNGSTNVALGTILAIDFSKYISLGTDGNVYIKNETDNTTQLIKTGSTFLKVKDKQLLISGVKFDVGKTYHVTFDSSIVDTALAAAYAIEDTTEWRFSTESALPHFMAEYFDTSCLKAASLPFSWSKYSSGGMEMWNCFEHNTGNSSVRMYGNDGAANTANEDWLISPKIDMSSPDAMAVSFHLYKSFSGNELQVMISHDYAGSGSPDSASWTAISLPMSAADVDKWMHFTFPVTAFKSQAFYVGFKYNSKVSAAYDIRVDSFMTMIKTGIQRVYPFSEELKVLGQSSSNDIKLSVSSLSAGNFDLELYNTLGQKMYARQIELHSGSQEIHITDIDFKAGMYIVKLFATNVQFLQKCIVR
ncbi:MAG: choice-of-anchor J domain-containing protein [Chitinophagaceae bacterium]